jgi:hypothetical protein
LQLIARMMMVSMLSGVITAATCSSVLGCFMCCVGMDKLCYVCKAISTTPNNTTTT